MAASLHEKLKLAEEQPLPADTVDASGDENLTDPAYRRGLLRDVHGILAANFQNLENAILADTSNTPAEAVFEISYTLLLLERLVNSSMGDPASWYSAETTHRWEPHGTVFIDPTTHTLLYSVICALAPALLAGNHVTLYLDTRRYRSPKSAPAKHYECAQTGDLVVRLLSQVLGPGVFHVTLKSVYFSGELLKVLQDECPEDANFRALRLVGSPYPVAIVDGTADVELAAKELVKARLSFSGKSSYISTQILVHPPLRRRFDAAIQRHAATFNANRRIRVVESASTPKWRRPRLSPLEWMVQDISSIHSIEEVLDTYQSSEYARKLTPVASLTSVASGKLYHAIIFADPSAADRIIKRLTNAAVTFIDHVPPELLIGPSPLLSHPFHLHERYPVAAFGRARRSYVASCATRKPTLHDLLSPDAPGRLSVSEQISRIKSEVARPMARQPYWSSGAWRSFRVMRLTGRPLDETEVSGPPARIAGIYHLSVALFWFMILWKIMHY